LLHKDTKKIANQLSSSYLHLISSAKPLIKEMCKIPEFVRSALEIIKFGYLLLSLVSDDKNSDIKE
jgi:hypothetical protein